jgi:branched-chain amino acid transport system substrate-binding protein
MNDLLRPNGLTRRQLVSGFAAGAGAIALGGGLRTARAAEAPIKVGCLNTFTKAWAAFGEDTMRGLNQYFEQIGWQSAGRKIEIIKEDDEMTPQTGLQKVRKLVESDRVDVICGPLASNVATAMLDYMKSAKVLWIITGAGADELTWAGLPNMYRNTLSFYQVAHALGAWTYDNVANSGAVSASDYVGGHDAVDDFKSGFVAKGGKVVKEFYPPFGTTDFSPYLTALRALKPAFSFNFYGGTDAVRFFKQYEQYGLKKTSQFVGFASTLDNDTFVGLGKTALGGLSAGIYCDTIESPVNEAFVKAFRAKYNGQFPTWNADAGYSTAMILDEALKAVKGDTSDKAALAKAVGAVKINAPRGPVSFDPSTHQAIQNVYVRRVVEIDGRIDNKVIDTIPDVGPGPRKGT